MYADRGVFSHKKKKMASLNHKMAILNSNPEVLLRKRKDADRKRIQRQEALREANEKKTRKSLVARDKFLRAEKLVIRSQANAVEAKRLNNILKHEARQAVSSRKEITPKLVFVIRTENLNRNVTIPQKAEAVFKVLRLPEPNMGVFVKLTQTVVPALKLVAPYIVVGTPSLASVRDLFHKRACIVSTDEEGNETEVKLNNNQLVEDKFGDDLGYICIEDVVHELVSLGENFKTVSRWIAPFKLTPPVLGWGPLAALNKIRYENEHKKPISLAGHVQLEEIDIDKFIEEQN